MKVYAQRNMMRQTVDFMFANGDVLLRWPDPEVIKREIGMIEEPSLSIPQETAQDLLDALFDAGYRPTKGQSNDTTIDALKGHIKFAERIALGE